ncbi:MAG TPA: dihydropteroate synthase [Acidimicrobiales bacterium]|nr:dihydropteroate synthase [Acidimicrobiales bacterium]
MALSPAVMGIVNVTPDSFFPASRTIASDEAVARGRSHFLFGADVVDVGGESTRPGATPVEADEELARVLPVIRALAGHGPVSIDTQKESVARAAVAAGAIVVNDVSSTLCEVAGELGVGYVAMHRQGDSSTMQDNPTYDDVVSEISDFLRAVAERARSAGVTKLWLDPGIGFGKTVEHNVALLAHVDHFVQLANEYDAGVMIGTSRKRFLGQLGRDVLDVDERLEGSLASEAWAMVQGVSMVRVHDVRETVQLRELLTRPLEAVTS